MHDRKRKRRAPRTYDDALKRPSRSVWPGCGDGRKRWCGRIHNYIYRIHESYYDDFRCWQNNEHGCPRPLPKVGETYEEWEARAHEARSDE